MLQYGVLSSLTTKALAESMTVKIMIAIAKKLIFNYNLHKRIGFPDSVPVPNLDAAKQIIKDMRQKDLFLELINLLIEVQEKGLMGRKYPISYLPRILNELQKQGFFYDKESKILVENPNIRKTKNWGILVPGRNYPITLLLIDIAGNSSLVREYSKEIIKDTYSTLRLIVQSIVEKRNGRIWTWEGDGGLVAFNFSSQMVMATLSSMEIINDLFIYNKTKCKLKNDLKIRVAIHNGPIEYSQNEKDILKSHIVKEIKHIESKYTKPNTVTLTTNIYNNLSPIISNQLKPIKSNTRVEYYKYSIDWEK